MVAPGAELLDRGFLQMKLATCPARAPTPTAEAVPAAGRPDVAADAAEAPASCIHRSDVRAAEARGGPMITRFRIAAVLALAVAFVGCGGGKTRGAARRAHRLSALDRHRQGVE
jgi:hypothetical protein